MNARPFWCDEPCPAWCDEQHHAGDHVADRRHIGATRTLALATMPAAEVITPGDPEWRPVELLLELAQGYREREPRIGLASTGDTPGAWLTLAEAAELARQITDLVALARGGEGDPRPTREIDIGGCTDPNCPICHGAGGHGGGR